jgi:hypothetical protein
MKTQKTSAALIAALIAVAVVTTDAAPVIAQTPAVSASYKDPSRARMMSILLPGSGQIYSGATGKGLLQMGLAIAGWATFASNIPTAEWVESDYYWANNGGYWRDYGDAGIAYTGLALALVTTVWSALDAPKVANAANESHGFACGPFKNIGLELASVKVGGRTATGLKMAMDF